MPFVGPGSTKTPADGSVDTAQLVDAAVTDPKVADGAVVQVVNVMDGEVATGTTTTPSDNSIPQNTEGTEVMTLAITPKSTTNKLKIEVVVQASHSGTNGVMVTALHQDSTANALAAVVQQQSLGTAHNVMSFTHYMAAGTVSETTFKVRLGGTAGTISFNGQSSARILGGVSASSITITEIKAS